MKENSEVPFSVYLCLDLSRKWDLNSFVSDEDMNNSNISR